MKTILDFSGTANEAGAFRIEWHESFRQHFLYVYLGIDPNDGTPTLQARPATDYEVTLWESGKRRKLALHLQRLGVPVKVPQSWVAKGRELAKRTWAKLKGAV